MLPGIENSSEIIGKSCRPAALRAPPRLMSHASTCFFYARNGNVECQWVQHRSGRRNEKPRGPRFKQRGNYSCCFTSPSTKSLRHHYWYSITIDIIPYGTVRYNIYGITIETIYCVCVCVCVSKTTFTRRRFRQ